MPEAKELLSIRRYILNHGDELEDVLKDKKFKKVFAGLDTDHVLKRPPKGFSANSEYAELLKFKSYTVSAPLKLEQVLKPGLGKLIDQHFKMIKPFNQFLLRALENK